MADRNTPPKEPDFSAFIEAVDAMELGNGVDTAACHHSAVEIRDWDRIQEKLREAAAQEQRKRDASVATD